MTCYELDEQFIDLICQNKVAHESTIAKKGMEIYIFFQFNFQSRKSKNMKKKKKIQTPFFFLSFPLLSLLPFFLFSFHSRLSLQIGSLSNVICQPFFSKEMPPSRDLKKKLSFFLFGYYSQP